MLKEIACGDDDDDDDDDDGDDDDNDDDVNVRTGMATLGGLHPHPNIPLVPDPFRHDLR